MAVTCIRCNSDALPGYSVCAYHKAQMEATAKKAEKAKDKKKKK